MLRKSNISQNDGVASADLFLKATTEGSIQLAHWGTWVGKVRKVQSPLSNGMNCCIVPWLSYTEFLIYEVILVCMARHSSFYSMKHTCFCADSSQIFSLSEEESTNKEYGFLGHSDYTKRPVFSLFTGCMVHFTWNCCLIQYRRRTCRREKKRCLLIS